LLVLTICDISCVDPFYYEVNEVSEQTDAQIRVAAGATYLDENIPNWRERVNPERLDISRIFSCVLAQLGEEYHAVARKLGLDDEQRVRLGFFVEPSRGFVRRLFGLPAKSNKREYQALTEAWRWAVAAEETAQP